MDLKILKVLPIVRDVLSLIFEFRYQRQALSPPIQWFHFVHESTIFLTLQLNCRVACREAGKGTAHAFLKDWNDGIIVVERF